MFKKLLVGAVAVPMLFTALSASAVTYSFSGLNITEDDLSSQLQLDVNQVGDNVSFQISNLAGGEDVFIGHIYFDFLGDNPFTSLDQTGQSGTVSFITDYDSGQNLSEGNLIGFTTDADATKDGAAANGINIGEYLVLSAALDAGADINALLTSGDLRIGLHLQGYANDASDSYVTGPSPVPLPAAAWLFASGLGFFGVARRRLSK